MTESEGAVHSLYSCAAHQLTRPAAFEAVSLMYTRPSAHLLHPIALCEDTAGIGMSLRYAESQHLS